MHWDPLVAFSVHLWLRGWLKAPEKQTIRFNWDMKCGFSWVEGISSVLRVLRGIVNADFICQVFSAFTLSYTVISLALAAANYRWFWGRWPILTVLEQVLLDPVCSARFNLLMLLSNFTCFVHRQTCSVWSEMTLLKTFICTWEPFSESSVCVFLWLLCLPHPRTRVNWTTSSLIEFSSEILLHFCLLIWGSHAIVHTWRSGQLPEVSSLLPPGPAVLAVRLGCSGLVAVSLLLEPSCWPASVFCTSVNLILFLPLSIRKEDSAVKQFRSSDLFPWGY